MKRKLSLCLAIGILALGAAAHADRLFIESAPADPDLFSKSSIDARLVRPNIDALLAGAEALDVTLSDGRTYSARLSDLEVRAADDVTWRGYLGEGHRVTITVKNGYAVGLVYSPDGVYELSTLRDGGQGFARVDQDLYAPCAVDGKVGYAHNEKGPRPTSASEPGALVELDVLGVYTDLARIGAGGPAAIAATIQAAVDNANTGFMDSNADARYNLVHTAEVPWVENGNGSSALSWVRNDPGVRALRNQYRADMVGMTIENWPAACGVAYVMRNPSHTFADSAFQVTARVCAVGNLTYAHEHGHNQGFEHDPANGAPPGSASHPFAFGHFVSGSYRTIMSYSNQCVGGCTRVAHWSNPGVTHNGVPTGIAGQRENWMASNLNDDYTELFRNGAIQSSVSGSCPGNVTIHVTNASPNSEVVMAIGTPGSNFQLMGTRCKGTIFSLGEPIGSLGPFVTDASGNGSRTVNLGAGDCGRQIFALDFASCTDSDPDPIP